MFAHRNFVYKRSHNSARSNFAAQPKQPLFASNPIGTPSSPSSDPQPTIPTAPLTPDPPTPTTSDTPTTSSPPSGSSSSPPTASTPSASSPTSDPASSPSSAPTSAASSATLASSHTLATFSSASTPFLVSPSSTYNAPASIAVTTQAITGISHTPTSSVAPSSTTSTGSSGGTNTGVIIGGVAGALAGIAVLGFLLMWCMRRQQNHDIDDFDAQAFKRQSAILVDDPVDGPRSRNLRPPTMIEHHNASPALAAQAGYQNFYGNYSGYGQQPTYPETSPSVPPQQAYATPPMGYAGYDDPLQMAGQPSNVGYAEYDTRQQLARQPSNAEYLTRQPSSAAGYAQAPPAVDPKTHYIDLNRSSVSPYQAAQYADISRQLGTSNPNGHAAPQPSVEELPDGPLPSPFDDPVEPNAVPSTTVHVHAGPAFDTVAAMQPHPSALAHHRRPDTFYGEGDAYSGI